MSTVELYRVLNDAHARTLSESEVREMKRLAEAVDLDGDGEISFLEFLEMMNGEPTALSVRAWLRITELREAFGE